MKVWALVWLVAPIAGPDEPSAPDFALDVVPVLTRAGCNAGACHGAALGQAGFKLSLLGDNPEADYTAVARQYRGRRVNTADPAASLLLAKPARAVSHRGGKRFDVGSEPYETIRRWIHAGAPPPRGAVRWVDLRVEPGASLSPQTALRVTARSSDGAERDVTRLALFDSLDDSIATVEEGGLTRVLRPGETAIMIRYAGFVRVARVGLPHAATRWDESPANFIDVHVNARLRRLGLAPGERAGDLRFRRRLWLDVVGRLPGEGDALESPAFEAYWDAWLSDQLGTPVSASVPLDETVRGILTALGPTSHARFYGDTRDPKVLAEQAAQRLLGRRIQCAQCHNHPFESFTQDDYYGFTAFFARVTVENGTIALAPRGEATHPRRRRIVAPAFPGGPTAPAAADRREPLAEWMVRQPDFARSIVNRLWAHFFGAGIVEPADDLRVSNPPSNPELLDALAEDFVANGHDLMRTIRLIVGSNAYRRNGAPRVPPPEVLQAMIHEVTRVAVRDLPRELSLEQALHLLSEVRVPLAVLPERDVVATLFLRALGRPPTAEERERFAEAETSSAAAADLLWALVNSKEFYFIH
jgi:hypothetical protein